MVGREGNEVEQGGSEPGKGGLVGTEVEVDNKQGKTEEVVVVDVKAPAKGLITVEVATWAPQLVTGGGWPRGKVLWQRPESPGRQRVHGVPLRTQAHLRHLAVPLQRQQRVLEAEK